MADATTGSLPQVHNVVIAEHIRAPENVRCRLTFGSFGMETNTASANVVIAEHIRVPENVRCRLTFGSFGMETNTASANVSDISATSSNDQISQSQSTSLPSTSFVEGVHASASDPVYFTTGSNTAEQHVTHDLPILGPSELPTRSEQKTVWGLIHGTSKKIAQELLHNVYDSKWVEDNNTSTLVLAILVAFVAYQAALQPPGGIWANDTPDPHNSKKIYPVGSAVKAGAGDNDFFIYNKYAFLSAVSIVLLIATGAPRHNKFCAWILGLLMSAVLTFMSLAYCETMRVVTAEPYYINTDTSRVKMRSDIRPTNLLPNAFYQLSNAYGDLMALWFFLLGAIVIFQLIVGVVWLLPHLYRFIIFLKTLAASATATTDTRT